MILLCEDGQQVEAHKVILAASSPFFQKILQRNKHPHPMIYLKGFQSKDLVAVLDFLYFGEANVYQEHLDFFLAIAEQLQLKGLTDQTSSNYDMLDEQEKLTKPKPVEKVKVSFLQSTACSADLKSEVDGPEEMPKPIPNQPNGDWLALDEKVKSMMERSKKTIPKKRANGTIKQEVGYICKLCGKEGQGCHIKHHIKTKHLEGPFIQSFIAKVN